MRTALTLEDRIGKALQDLAFVRITTHSRIMLRPLTVDAALAYVERWLAVPGVSLVNAVPTSQSWACRSRSSPPSSR